ncbi:MAG TPA: Hsp20/alpha crystallin family protein [Rhizomicrobium sp.]|nr:Hsp20/alpha crystallin family protein [Rhizomicrobium sp.]
MADTKTTVPAKPEPKAPVGARAWHPFESLRHEVDRLFDDFDGGLWPAAFRKSFFGNGFRSELATAVDVVEKADKYEITAELPGMDEKDVEVKVASGGLTIRGEKREEKEEKKKDYFLSERRYGSFERNFGLPEGVDTNKIEASFKKGILTITLPKTPEAQKQEKKIAIKAA